MDYKYNTQRKIGDFIIFPYDKIKFDLKYHILPYYSKKAHSDIIIENELQKFYDGLTGIVVESEYPSDERKFQIKFNGGGNMLFDNDTYLNDCTLAVNEEDAKCQIYRMMERSINELRLPLKSRIMNFIEYDNRK